MNREPINPDDPRMTDYLLGELAPAERADFESRLLHSPEARGELASMQHVMDLLGEGLRHEWLADAPASLFRVVEHSTDAETKVVRPAFLPRLAKFAAAAAVGALLLVGSALHFSGSTPEDVSLSDVGIPGQSAAGPRLFLAEEIDDLSILQLADGSDASDSSIDASYLEADSVLPASYKPFAKGSSMERGDSLDRVDSYLPPVGSLVPVRGTTGMIENRLESRNAGGSSDRGVSVLVSGYVTMGGGGSAAARPRSFQPVSISGNPVVNEENELRLLAELNSLQKALAGVVEGLPEEASERADLERVLDRSRRVVSQMVKELSF